MASELECSSEGMKDEKGTAGCSSSNLSGDAKKKAMCVIVLGMAGSGKTTFVRQLNSHLIAKGNKCYVMNLDPAVNEVPYPVNIDIRDTVKYKQVMQQYGLGPNGAIMTSLNIFATKFHQVLDLVEKRMNNEEVDYVLVDTPGQIEVFTWSASGAIISEAMASLMPTVVVYVMDTQRSSSTVTFMSNMLYACSILYKSRLPLVVAMNKTDIVSHAFAEEWMRDWTVFEDSLSAQQSSYSANLARSMSLALEEFYQHLRCVGVSSLAGVGFEKLEDQLNGAREEYNKDYKAQYEKIKAEKLQQNMDKLKADRIQEKETEKTKVNVQQNIESESSMEEEQDKNGHQGTPSVSNQ